MTVCIRAAASIAISSILYHARCPRRFIACLGCKRTREDVVHVVRHHAGLLMHDIVDSTSMPCEDGVPIPRGIHTVDAYSTVVTRGKHKVVLGKKNDASKSKRESFIRTGSRVAESVERRAQARLKRAYSTACSLRSQSANGSALMEQAGSNCRARRQSDAQCASHEASSGSRWGERQSIDARYRCDARL